MHVAPRGYSRAPSQQLRTNATNEAFKHDQGKHNGGQGGKGSKGQSLFNLEDCTSALDLFVMLRTTLSPEKRRQMETELEGGRENGNGKPVTITNYSVWLKACFLDHDSANKPECLGASEDSEQDKVSWVASPAVIDVYLTSKTQYN